MAAGPDPTRPSRVALTTYVPEHLADELHQIAAATQVSRSELLRRIAGDFVAGVSVSTTVGAPA